MKVHLIRKESIAEYVLKNAQSRTPFTQWQATIKYADWENRKIYKILSRARIYWELVRAGRYLILAGIIIA